MGRGQASHLPLVDGWPGDDAPSRGGSDDEEALDEKEDEGWIPGPPAEGGEPSRALDAPRPFDAAQARDRARDAETQALRQLIVSSPRHVDGRSRARPAKKDPSRASLPATKRGAGKGGRTSREPAFLGGIRSRGTSRRINRLARHAAVTPEICLREHAGAQPSSYRAPRRSLPAARAPSPRAPPGRATRRRGRMASSLVNPSRTGPHAPIPAQRARGAALLPRGSPPSPPAPATSRSVAAPAAPGDGASTSGRPLTPMEQMRAKYKSKYAAQAPAPPPAGDGGGGAGRADLRWGLFGRAIGVDFGPARTGVAFSAGGYSPRPLEIVRMRSGQWASATARILELARQNAADGIVVGLPVTGEAPPPAAPPHPPPHTHTLPGTSGRGAPAGPGPARPQADPGDGPPATRSDGRHQAAGHGLAAGAAVSQLRRGARGRGGQGRRAGGAVRRVAVERQRGGRPRRVGEPAGRGDRQRGGGHDPPGLLQRPGEGGGAGEAARVTAGAGGGASAAPTTPPGPQWGARQAPRGGQVESVYISGGATRWRGPSCARGGGLAESNNDTLSIPPSPFSSDTKGGQN